MRDAVDERTVQQYATVGQVSATQVGHYLTRISPVIEDGAVTSLVMIATDVTDLQEQRLRLQVALDSAGQGMWTYRLGEKWRRRRGDSTCSWLTSCCRGSEVGHYRSGYSRSSPGFGSCSSRVTRRTPSCTGGSRPRYPLFG
jgi:hypothetical protein